MHVGNFKLFLLSLLIALSLSNCKQDKKETFQSTGIAEVDQLSSEIAANPQDPALYYARAEALYQAQNFDASIADLEKALSLDSSQYAYYHLLADNYLDYNKSRTALFIMERAATKFPTNIPTLLKLSEMQYILQLYDGSLATLQRIFMQNPQEAEAFFMQGRVYEEKGDTVRARVSFEKAIQFDEDLVDAWLHLGNLMAAKKDPKALSCFESAVRISKEEPYVLFALAYYYQQQKRWKDALQVYDQVIAADKHYADAFFNKGYIYLEMDSTAKAWDHFNIVVNLDPAYRKGYYYRGLASMEQAQWKKAEADLKQALVLDPGFERATLALKQVQMELSKAGQR